jgi:ketopantoate reductase
METTGHECLRCHVGLESKLPGGGTIRHFLQVRIRLTLPATERQWLTSSGRAYSGMNVSNHDMVCIRLTICSSSTDDLAVVQNPEDAASREAAFDYVLLCVKALPDVYNLADIIESVVTPQHTCILVNTTNTLGVEQQLEERFPTNVVLSLVSGAEIWVGPANINSSIPEAIQNDMSEALAMTLSTGQVDCKVSSNIRQQQYERMIGQETSIPGCLAYSLTLIQAHSFPSNQCLIRDPGPS